MAINKVVNKSTKSHGAMRNVLEYVLRDQKVKDGYVEIAGPYSGDTINYDDVYQSWLAEKRLWDKDSGRMYAHNIISFHKDEEVTPEQVLDIGKEFAEKFFSGHQYVIGVHQDKDHLHCHIVTNSVSYIDGLKLHQTKRDLEHQKEFTNNLCLERGLTIAEKGHHFDGSLIEQGEITAWSKDKYNLLLNDTKKSFVAECAIAIMEVVPQSASRDEFISGMEERGWSVQWEDSRKHIVFQNQDGNKVRDTNIEKTFAGMEVNKEALLNEFTRQNELRLARIKAEHDRAAERERADAELRKYYAEIESATEGLDTAKAVRDYTEITAGTGQSNSGMGTPEEARETGRSEDDTDAFIRDIQSEIDLNRDQNRTVRDTENKSVSYDQQSHTRETERRLEEQQRAIEQEAAREVARRHSRSHGFER